MTAKPPPPSEKIDAIARQWHQHSILNPAMLEQLYEINRIYLNMLAVGKSAWIGRQQHLILPDPVTASLMELEPSHRDEIARCPFSLFNAKFQDAAFWTSFASAGMVREAVLPFADIDTPRGGSAQFAEMALFYVWHLVRSHPLAAQLLLGMKNQAIAVFKKMSLARLQQISTDHPDLIAPRWPDRTRFWEIMLGAAQKGEMERLTELRSLGIQMIAAELATPMLKGRARTAFNPSQTEE